MDPTHCLHRIEDALLDRDFEDADWACEDLNDWLNRGGYEPEWGSSAAGSAYFAGWRKR